MYLVSDKTEGLFLKKRQNTVKAAIQEGKWECNVCVFSMTRPHTYLYVCGAAIKKTYIQSSCSLLSLYLISSITISITCCHFLFLNTIIHNISYHRWCINHSWCTWEIFVVNFVVIVILILIIIIVIIIISSIFIFFHVWFSFFIAIIAYIKYEKFDLYFWKNDFIF